MQSEQLTVLTRTDRCSLRVDPACSNVTCETVCGDGDGVSGHPMKAYGKSGCIAPLILNFGLNVGEWYISHPGRFFPVERTPRWA